MAEKSLPAEQTWPQRTARSRWSRRQVRDRTPAAGGGSPRHPFFQISPHTRKQTQKPPVRWGQYRHPPEIRKKKKMSKPAKENTLPSIYPVTRNVSYLSPCSHAVLWYRGTRTHGQQKRGPRWASRDADHQDPCPPVRREETQLSVTACRWPRGRPGGRA